MPQSPKPMALGSRTFYVPGAVNAAIIETPNRGAIIVDTGGDKSYGRAIAAACKSLDLTPTAIVNTHSHADHIGGNDYLQRAFEVEVYAPDLESAVIEHPYLEPIYLFGGAKPLPELKTKWLMAKPSRVDRRIEPGTLDIDGVRLKVLETSGHAHRHLSIVVDDILLAADALFGEAALEKYPLPFGQDVGRQIASARALGETEVRVLLPGHGEPTEHVVDLAALNLDAFDRAAAAVASACQGGDSAQVLALACKELGIVTNDLPRYYLNLCTVMAYLSHLREAGRVELTLMENRLSWRVK